MNRVYALQRLWLLMVICASLLAVGCTTVIKPPENTTTAVILIRHAEKAAVTKELTEAGHARAAALPEAVADLQIAAIYSPNLSRNLDTARPLASQLGLEINILSDIQRWEAVALRLVSEHPGKSVLWVGNRSNLILLYALLGGKGEPPLEYGEMSILQVLEDDETKVEERHFGNLYFN